VSKRRRPSVLVLRALGLGDLLTAIPALRALQRSFPDYALQLALPSPLHDLAIATGAVDAVLDVQPLQPLPTELPSPEVAVNLHGRGPQSHLVLSRTQPRKMLAFRNEEAGFFDGPGWTPDEHERVRWCRMLGAFGIASDPGNMFMDLPPNGKWRELTGATLIHPGAASIARRWPAKRFAAVAKSEFDMGRKVVVTGSPSERELALGVCAHAGLPSEACVAGDTTVTQLAAIVGAAGRVVCGDTGIAHLAAALRTPSVTLFGPTSPEHWGPPPGPHIALWSGRTGDPHASQTDPGLLEIEPATVIEALSALP
jgi:ADP-heptose:LPS heptosyltransferase